MHPKHRRRPARPPADAETAETPTPSLQSLSLPAAPGLLLDVADQVAMPSLAQLGIEQLLDALPQDVDVCAGLVVREAVADQQVEVLRDRSERQPQVLKELPQPHACRSRVAAIRWRDTMPA